MKRLGKKGVEMIGNALKCAVLGLILLSIGGVFAVAAPAGAGGHPAAVSAPFERLKGLAGEWVAAEDGEMFKKGDVVSRYAVTASGSAVVETVFPGSPHEMVTVYSAEGPDLVLTHYCMEGNQPRMRAKNPKGSSRLDFAFDGGNGIDPKKDRHMNSASLEFVGPDELSTVWTKIEAGKPVFVAKSRLVRKPR
jgi:hypothetical protein